MKSPALLALLALASLSGCATPEPTVVERHHYHTERRNVYVPVTRSQPPPRKSAPSVGGESSAESFRAVERPGSYSQ